MYAFPWVVSSRTGNIHLQYSIYLPTHQPASVAENGSDIVHLALINQTPTLVLGHKGVGFVTVMLSLRCVVTLRWQRLYPPSNQNNLAILYQQ